MDGISNQSEIVQILPQIARMEHMGLLHQNLQAIVGNDTIQLITEHLGTIPNERRY